VDGDRLTIRSYRVCFRLERRIYRIDRFRVPVSWGVPLRSLGYAAAALLAVLLLQRLPLLGDLIRGLHPALRYFIAPVAIAYVLTALEVDGRAAHEAVAAWLRFVCAPRQLLGTSRTRRPAGVLRLAEIAVAPDERVGRYRRARVHGPATLVLSFPCGGRRRRRRLRCARRPSGRSRGARCWRSSTARRWSCCDPRGGGRPGRWRRAVPPTP
jgi:hypothetical protein